MMDKKNNGLNRNKHVTAVQKVKSGSDDVDLEAEDGQQDEQSDNQDDQMQAEDQKVLKKSLEALGAKPD